MFRLVVERDIQRSMWTMWADKRFSRDHRTSLFIARRVLTAVRLGALAADIRDYILLTFCLVMICFVCHFICNYHIIIIFSLGGLA